MHLGLYLLLATLGSLVPAAAVPTQAASTQPEKLSCSTLPVHKNFGRRKLWEGYEVSVGPTAHFKDDSGADDACTAAIYDASGKEVYRTTGPGIMLDPATGLDIDGDGSPDAVLLNGASGGSGGSWEIEVLSLKPQLHLLFKSEIDFPPAPFKKDSQQRVVLWSGESGSDLVSGYGWPNAVRPSAQRIYRFFDGKLQDTTAEYCSEIEASPRFQKMQRGLTPQDIDKFRSSENLEDLEVEDMTTGGKVLSLVLQRILCRQFDRALDSIHQMWPKQDQPNLIKNLQNASKNWNCPECAAQLQKWQ
jgi:hypothetical protein